MLVLLGAPGAGKSTLLRRFQLDTAIDALRSGDERVSFFVSLNDYKLNCGEPLEWLSAEWAFLYPGLPKLDALLAQGKAVLLLDAVFEGADFAPGEGAGLGSIVPLLGIIKVWPTDRTLLAVRLLT